MASGRVKDYYEPWIVTKSRSWESSFKFGPPSTAHLSKEEQQQGVLDWEDAKVRAEKNAEMIVWGSRMDHPSVAKNLDGSVVVVDDRRIIGIAKSATWPESGIGHEHLAKRLAECVNACAGIADPVQFIKDVRALTLSYCKGECEDPRIDPRVVSLLSRCIPPEEYEEFKQEGFE